VQLTPLALRIHDVFLPILDAIKLLTWDSMQDIQITVEDTSEAVANEDRRFQMLVDEQDTATFQSVRMKMNKTNHVICCGST